MPLYTFRCLSGHEHDALGVRGVPLLRPCPECGSDAERLSIYAPSLTGEARVPLDQREVKMGDFNEAGAELAYAEDRAEAGGDPSQKKPSLWKAAKRQATDLQRRGVKDSSDFRGTADGAVKHQTRWLGTRLMGDTK